MPEPTERDLSDLRRLRRKAGSRPELIRWLDQCQEVKCGRPPLDLIKDFSVHEGPEKDIYVAHYKLGKETYVVIVRSRKQRMGKVVTLTPHKVFHMVAETYHKAYGHSRDALAQMLAKKFSRKLAELKKAL
jgi:hypothetical protein